MRSLTRPPWSRASGGVGRDAGGAPRRTVDPRTFRLSGIRHHLSIHTTSTPRPREIPARAQAASPAVAAALSCLASRSIVNTTRGFPGPS